MMWMNVVLLLSVIAEYSEAKPDIEISYRFSDEWCKIDCSATDMPANSELLLSKNSPEDNSLYYFAEGHPEYEYNSLHDERLSDITVWITSNYLQWEGEYMCIVREKTSDPTTWTTEPVHIKYTTSPEITKYKYDRNLNLGFLVNGTDFQYECIATGIPKPNITWTKEGDDQFLSVLLLSKNSPEDNSLYYFAEGHPEYEYNSLHDERLSDITVWITSNYLQWEGEYMCIVREKTSDPTTWTTEPVHIKYTTSPEITKYKYDRNLNLGFLVNGTDFQYECIATGIPKPNITWTKEGDDQFLSVGPLLHFPSITKAESGRYFCIADNGVGREKGVRISIEVTKYKPTMKYDSIPVRTVTEYEINEYWVDGKMQVLVHGCPHPTVTWWKESENGRTKITEEDNSYEHAFIIQRGWDYSCYTDTIEHTEYSLKMHRFNKSDLGTYVVKAESSLGIVELKFIIRLNTD